MSDPNPYESPRALPLPPTEVPVDNSLEADLRRKMVRVAICFAFFAAVGAAAGLAWMLSL